MLLASLDPRIYENQSRLFLVSYPTFPENFMKSIYPFFCNVANRHGFPEKKIEKEIMYARG